MTSDFHFSEWPPFLYKEHQKELILHATTYALSHGLLYLPPSDQQPSMPTSAIHAPISLFPAPFPRKAFELAQRLQRLYNVLYARIAMDEEFLDSVMGATDGVGQVDEFVGQLWTGWKKLRDGDGGGGGGAGISQPLQLGIFRSDYLLHTEEEGTLSLKQVEFNTISASFGALSERTAAMHQSIHTATHFYSSAPCLDPANYPPNHTTAGLVEGLVEAHKVYNKTYAIDESTFPTATQILFVVQDNERNVFDQRWLEYELLEKHGIHVVRQTLTELCHSATTDPHTKALHISLPLFPYPLEISVVYFRAGYTPTDFPTPTHYVARFILEESTAIKCPSIPLQLAGGKKVQQVLTKPGVLESFLCDAKKWGSEVTQEELIDIRGSWVGMWGLDEDDGVQRARDKALSLVLKPQREGGGNNVYKESIPAFLDTLDIKEREAWIAMELIVPPEGTGAYLVRSGGAEKPLDKTDVVSELGIFGWALFGAEGGEVKEKEVGWLVRTKGKETNEGGVATGFSVLDSLALVDVDRILKRDPNDY